MLNVFIYFIDFLLKRKCYKTQNNQKFKQKFGEQSIKIFTTLLNNSLLKCLLVRLYEHNTQIASDMIYR